MKRVVIFLLSLTILFSLFGCHKEETAKESRESVIEESEGSLHCDICYTSIEQEDYIETDREDYLCVPCAFDEGYTKCQNCNLYFVSDAALDSTTHYCSSCAYDYASGCCLCGSGPLDYDQLVEFIVENEPYYMCVYCCAGYFVNVEPMNPCSFCIMCGEVFAGKPYPHYIYDGTVVCKDCITKNGFLQCKLCKKYYDEGENNICGYCIEKNESY